MIKGMENMELSSIDLHVTIIILAFCCNIVYPILITLSYNGCARNTRDKNSRAYKSISMAIPLIIAGITTILALCGGVWAFLITIVYEGVVASMIRYVTY